MENRIPVEETIRAIKYFIGVILDPSEDQKEKKAADDFIRELLFTKAAYMLGKDADLAKELLYEGTKAMQKKDYEIIFCKLLDCNKEWFAVKLETAQAMI